MRGKEPGRAGPAPVRPRPASHDVSMEEEEEEGVVVRVLYLLGAVVVYLLVAMIGLAVIRGMRGDDRYDSTQASGAAWLLGLAAVIVSGLVSGVPD